MKKIGWVGVTAGVLSGVAGALLVEGYDWSLLSVAIVGAIIGLIVGAVFRVGK